MPVYPDSTFRTVKYFGVNVWPKSGGGFVVIAIINPDTVNEAIAFTDTTQVTCAAALSSWQGQIGEAIPIPQNTALVKARFRMRTPPDASGSTKTVKVEIVSTGAGLVATVELDRQIKNSQAVTFVIDGINLAITALTNAYAAPNSAEGEYVYGISS